MSPPLHPTQIRPHCHIVLSIALSIALQAEVGDGLETQRWAVTGTRTPTRASGSAEQRWPLQLAWLSSSVIPNDLTDALSRELRRPSAGDTTSVLLCFHSGVCSVDLIFFF